MCRCVLLCCFVVMWCVGVSTTLECHSPNSRTFKFSVVSRRNITGQWTAQVQLEHGGGPKVEGPWETDIEHTVVKCQETESILIVATVTGPPSSSSSPPAPGYDLVPGMGYYKLHTDVKAWHEALKVCEEEGAHLAVINSEDEAKALGPFWDMNPKILDGNANNWAHIGFHDLYKEGEYLTIFNTSLVAAGYVKWDPTEPHGHGHNCGCAFRRDNLLGDIPCNEKQPFFCEKELY